MRSIIAAAALGLLATSASAFSPPKDGAPLILAQASPAPGGSIGTPAPSPTPAFSPNGPGALSAPQVAPSAAPSTTRPPRQTLAQRFDEANTTHDGRLTKEQAAAARWAYINRNFDGIDKAKHGYVTVDDIRAFAAERRAARRAAQGQTRG